MTEMLSNIYWSQTKHNSNKKMMIVHSVLFLTLHQPCACAQSEYAGENVFELISGFDWFFKFSAHTNHACLIH